jgi:hypothetical protein
MPRERRPPFTFKSGAVYEGEWRGNMRDGYGSGFKVNNIKSNNGLMEPNTKESGKTTKPMERANFGTLTETFLRENGRMTRQTVLLQN